MTVEVVYPVELDDLPAVRVVNDVLEEMGLQDAQWGEQSLPNFHPNAEPGHPRFRMHGIRDERTLRDVCEWRTHTGELSWADILMEEVAEAVGTDSDEELREELIQVAAVVHQWIGCIDRRRQRVEQAAWEAAQ